MMAFGLFWREDGEAARQLLIKISFLLGSASPDRRPYPQGAGSLAQYCRL